MLLFLVLLAVSCVHGESPKTCCWDYQCEYTINEIGIGSDSRDPTRIEEFEEVMSMHYDYLHRRQAFRFKITNEDGTLTEGRRVLDHIMEKQYRFDVAGNNCTVTDIPRYMNKPCIPKNSTLIGSAYMGYGNNKLRFDSWLYERGNTSIHADLSPETCTPVIFTAKGVTFGNITEVAFEIRNYKVGIKDTSVFQVPLSCTGQRLKRDIEDDEPTYREYYTWLF